MELGKGFSVEYSEGKVVLSAKVAELLNPILDSFKQKIESGEIDPIKGTDLDKAVLTRAIDFLKAEINK
jgi:hypothetical protein